MARRQGDQGRIGTPANPPADWQPHVNYAQVRVSLSPEIGARVDKYCEDEERARSWVIRKALDEWLSKRGY